MNLWLRMLWLLSTARWRGSLSLPADASSLTFRVWPHDLDLSLHMNNGRYLTLMDLGRLDIMVRSGLWRAVIDNRWTPIASTVTIHFCRELTPFQSFQLETKLLSWDTTFVVMEQTFVFNSGERRGQIGARGLFKGGLYDRKARAFVPIKTLMATIGVAAESPGPSPEVAAFLKADAELKQSARN